MSVATERYEVVDELRRADKLLLVTHENPDVDALGSLLGMHLILEQLGKDSVMFMSADQFPLPYEYQRMPLGDVRPADQLDVAKRLSCESPELRPVWARGRSRRGACWARSHRRRARP